jgi:hypothetical protein
VQTLFVIDPGIPGFGRQLRGKQPTMLKKFLRRCMGGSLLVVAAWMAMAAPASAGPVLLTYTGPAFTEFFPVNNPPVTYTSANHISVSVLLAAPLGANPGGNFFTPLSFSISDGIYTITQNNAITYPGQLFPEFFFGTDAGGNIFGWSVSAFADVGNTIVNLGTYYNPYTPQYWDTVNNTFCSGPLTGHEIGCAGPLVAAGARYKVASATIPAGAGWTVQAVPEPSTWALMLGGLGLLAVVRRTRARAGANRLG